MHMFSLLFIGSLIAGRAQLHHLVHPLGFQRFHLKGCICTWIHQFFMWWLGLDTSQGSQCAFHPENIIYPLGGRNLQSSQQIKAGNNLTTDHSHTRPADILEANCASGRAAAFDISVTSPLNTFTLIGAGSASRGALVLAEERKHVANDVKCHELGWICVPLVTESYGAWGSSEVVEAFSQLAS